MLNIVKNRPVDIEGDELFPRVNWAKADPLPRMLPIPETFEYVDHVKTGHVTNKFIRST